MNNHEDYEGIHKYFYRYLFFYVQNHKDQSSEYKPVTTNVKNVVD